MRCLCIALMLMMVVGGGLCIRAQQQSVPDDNAYESDFFRFLSVGWFPRPYTAIGYYVGSTLNFYQHSSAHAITTAGTRPIAGTWSADSPYRSSEDAIKKPWSDDDADNDFPSLGYSAPIIARAQWNVPFLHCILRADVMYEISRERLFSLDTTRKYLSLRGRPTSFREVSVLFNNEHFLGARLGLTIPLYGVFVASEPLRLDTTGRFSVDHLSSFYFVGGSVQSSVLVLSEATQYVQIADAKSALRYANGQDTVTLLDKTRLSTAAPVRWYAEICAGWQATFSVFSFCIEAYAAFPLSSALTDARWMLYRYGIRTVIGWER